MANTKSAEKRVRQAPKRESRNTAYRSRMRTAVKKLRLAVAAGDAEKAAALLPETLSILDQTAQKRVVHKNAAARTKSRLVKAVASLS